MLRMTGRGPLATVFGLALAGLLWSGCGRKMEVGTILAQSVPPFYCNTSGSVRIDPPKNVPGDAVFKWQGNEFVTVTSTGGTRDLTVPFRTADRPGQGQITFWIEVEGRELPGTRRICVIDVVPKEPPPPINHINHPRGITLSQNAPWEAQGGKGGAVRKSRYDHGMWTIWADLPKPDAYVQLFFDLTQEPIKRIERNKDGSYNLAGYTWIAQVTADPEFASAEGAANGVQWIFYTHPDTDHWIATEGGWHKASSAMRNPPGQPIDATVPNGLTSVAGIAVKFTIGSNSSTVIRGGKFNVLGVTIEPPGSR